MQNKTETKSKEEIQQQKYIDRCDQLFVNGVASLLAQSIIMGLYTQVKNACEELLKNDLNEKSIK